MGKFVGIESGKVVTMELVGRKEWKVILMGTEFLFGIIKKFWTQVVVMVTQHECT